MCVCVMHSGNKPYILDNQYGINDGFRTNIIFLFSLFRFILAWRRSFFECLVQTCYSGGGGRLSEVLSSFNTQREEVHNYNFYKNAVHYQEIAAKFGHPGDIHILRRKIFLLTKCKSVDSLW